MTRRVKTHIRLNIRSVSPSEQSPRCPHEETSCPHLPIAKFRGVSPRNVAEFLREFLGVSPRNFVEKTLGEISDFLFFSAKEFFSRKGVPKRNAKKELFLGLICI